MINDSTIIFCYNVLGFRRTSHGIFLTPVLGVIIHKDVSACSFILMLLRSAKHEYARLSTEVEKLYLQKSVSLKSGIEKYIHNWAFPRFVFALNVFTLNDFFK